MARRRTGFQKKIDNTSWDGFALISSSQSAGNVGLNFFTNGLDRPVTIMRIRGELTAWLDGVQTPGTSLIVMAGIIKVP